MGMRVVAQGLNDESPMGFPAENDGFDAER